MTDLLIIADDLTGAADAASYFAQHGFATAVLLRETAELDADVISFSTNTRDLPEPLAIERVSNATGDLLRATLTGRLPLVYKKMDSALRGHVGAELLAVMRAMKVESAIVAPALPSEGRTTIDGHQLVHGEPVERSAFASPGISSDLAALVRSAADEIRVRTVPLDRIRSGPIELTANAPGITICDAETDADLDVVAAAAIRTGFALLAGSAGLAHALERSGAIPIHCATPPLTMRTRKPVLVIAGTRHEATARQIEFAAAHGAIVIRPAQNLLDRPDSDFSAVAIEIGALLASGRHVILTTSGCETCSVSGDRIAAQLARVMDYNHVRNSLGGLVLTGGDIAAAVASQLEADAIWLRGEVRPAIPWGTLAGGRLRNLPVVTKAGSFGSPDAIHAGIQLLTQIEN